VEKGEAPKGGGFLVEKVPFEPGGRLSLDAAARSAYLWGLKKIMFGLLLMFPALASATVIKCVGPSGDVVYSAYARPGYTCDAPQIRESSKGVVYSRPPSASSAGYSSGNAMHAPRHVGPRGGVYHWSKNGKKVYEKRR
jgi:hypothetical protein